MRKALWVLLPTVGLLLANCAVSDNHRSSENTEIIVPQTKDLYKGLGAESVEKQALEKFAPPAVDHGTAQMIQNMLEIQSPGAGLLTHDKKTMYFGWMVTGTPQVWKLDGAMRFPLQVTSGSDATSLFDVTPDGKYLVLSRDRAGEENPGLYLLPTKGGPLIRIQHKRSVRTRPVWVTDDSEYVFYTANDITPDSFALYRYHIRTGRKDLLFSDPGIWFVSDVDHGTRFLLSRATGARTREYFEWNLNDKKLIPVIGQGESEQYTVHLGPGERNYFVLTSKFGEFQRMYRLKSGQLKALSPEVGMDIEGFRVDQPRRRLYMSWNDNGYSRVEVYDTETFEKIDFPQFKDADQVDVASISRDGETVTLSVETSVSPRESWVYDWRKEKLEQWVRPSIPEVDTSLFVKTETEYFLTRTGVRIPMLVTRPQKCAQNPCPVVVNFHGGPEGQSRPGFSRLSQIFAGSGFVFVEPNVRGSDGYGKSWLAADDGAKRLDVITDIEDCAKYIRSKWSIDGVEPKMGVMGWSYGGYATLMAMSRFAGSYDAGVALVGMSNLRTFLLNTAPYRRIMRISEYGDPDKDREALEKLSPTSYLQRIKSPLLIIQGVSDPRVPAGEAIQMHTLLQEKGLRSSLILFADEGHGSIKRENRVLELGNTLKFFQEHLLK